MFIWSHVYLFTCCQVLRGRYSMLSKTRDGLIEPDLQPTHQCCAAEREEGGRECVGVGGVCVCVVWCVGVVGVVVCERGRERVHERKSWSVCVRVCVREGERESTREERLECLCVCVCVCVCVCARVCVC